MQSQVQAFTVLDWLGTVVAGFSALALAMFPITGRSFAGMFNDLGSRAELPLLTRLATTTWFPLLLVIPVVTTLALGLRGRHALSTRRLWIVSAFLLGGVSFAVCLVGVYLPIFSIAGAIVDDRQDP